MHTGRCSACDDRRFTKQGGDCPSRRRTVVQDCRTGCQVIDIRRKETDYKAIGSFFSKQAGAGSRSDWWESCKAEDGLRAECEAGLIVKLSPYFIDSPGFAALSAGAEFEGAPALL